MANIIVSNLSFVYDGSYAKIFEDVSFTMDSDWKLGFIGRNGRGKTTFLKLLMGEYEYTGTISAPVEFDYFPFEVTDEKATVIQIAVKKLPILEYEIWRLEKEFSLLDLDQEVLYRQFADLSGGEKTKVMLAVLFLKEGGFLLIDEPTNHLDILGRKAVAQYLKSKTGFILVSHDRRFLDECVDHILSINKTNIEIQAGNFSSWMHNKTMQDEFEIAENKKLMGEISRLSASSKRARGWSDNVERSKFGVGKTGEKVADRGYVGRKAADMMRRSKATERRKNRAVDEKKSLLHNIEMADMLSINRDALISASPLKLHNVSVNINENTILSQLSLEVKKGERLAIIGGNGTGKSTLLKAILGEISYEGEIIKGSDVKFSYIPQQTYDLAGDLSKFAKVHELDDAKFKTLLYKLDFHPDLFTDDMSSYSAGQKKKVYIAKSLTENANFYIWDEPLNFIDYWSRIQVIDVVLENDLTLIAVEHDRDFVEEVMTRKFEIF